MSPVSKSVFEISLHVCLFTIVYLQIMVDQLKYIIPVVDTFSETY